MKVVFEDSVSLSADSWRHDFPAMKAGDPSWNLLTANLKSNSTTWSVTPPFALVSDLNRHGIETTEVRGALGPPPKGGVDRVLIDKLGVYKPLGTLPLGDSQTWLLSNSSCGELVVFRGGNGSNGGGGGTGGNIGSLPDPEPNSCPHPFVIENAHAYLAAYERKWRATLTSLSARADLSFLVAGNTTRHLVMVTSKGVESIDAEESSINLVGLQRLLDKNDGKPIVVLSDIRPWDVTNADISGLVSEVKRLSKNRYEVYADGIPDRAVESIRQRPMVQGPATVAVYRGGLLDTRGAELARMSQLFGFKNSTDASPLSEANIIVVTAHKSADYRNYLMELSRNGALNGKVVLLASCATKPDGAFVSELLSHDGAPRVVVRFTKEIDPAHALSLIKEVGILLKASPDKELHLESLLDDAFAKMVSDASTDSERREINNLRHFVVQVS